MSTTPTPPDTRCRAVVGGSTREDTLVFRCNNPIVVVRTDGRMIPVDEATPADLANLDYYSIWCKAHRVMQLHAQQCDDYGQGPGRDADGNRRVGPQRILKHQTERVTGG